MLQSHDPASSRRAFLKGALVVGSAIVIPGCAQRVAQVGHVPAPLPPVAAPLPAQVAARPTAPLGIRPELFRRALASLDQHRGTLAKHDRLAIADFAASSSTPRFHLVDLVDGSSTSLLVAHGSGSDPAHTGWLQRFSNDDGSNASCEGAFLASDYYVGKHGRSQRLIGLDPTNNNALSRAIVVHGAWYSNQDMLATHGKLGRSQGCFAVGETALQTVFDALGEGRMIYAAKV
ncbi:murein L,D-transpeptidase catalytic domain family protein [Sphingomonas donggukensis]|uniref:Murein L,D-transpeptidase catalytic domain family protein n=1 Tax=Sphingomonas donggukensis TaxID=2949093 RepID=A0ABY4TVE6_9SPHN|nr:murein L,D-transpeptidase catalytic domain family protein [Sphingomonas donggukensis]URW76352.1 murein L,D-transpeptidase catalytic domain family protein [Sphingomonas donggukensis]